MARINGLSAREVAQMEDRYETRTKYRSAYMPTYDYTCKVCGKQYVGWGGICPKCRKSLRGEL